MYIRLVETQEEFLELKNEWNRLSNELLAINSFEWNYKWWLHHKENKTIKIIVVEVNNKILGIAPLCIEEEKRFKIFNFKKLTFLGGSITDYTDFLIDENCNRDNVFNMLMEFSHKKISCDFIEFEHINTNYKNFDLWKKYSQKYKMNFEKGMICKRIKLDEYNSYEDYLSSISSRHKRNIVRSINKINRELGEFELVVKQTITEEEFDAIARINIERQEEMFKKGFSNRFCYFLNKKYLAFMKDYFLDNSTKKELVCIKLNEKIMAYMLSFSVSNKFAYWNGTFDMKYDKYAPLKVLFAKSIEHGFENNYKFLDFMRGDDSYKKYWTNHDEYNYIVKKDKTFLAKISECYHKTIREFFKKKFKSQEYKIHT